MIIPRAGDTWEFKLPEKQKKVKVIDYISWEECQKKNGSTIRKPFVNWKRLPRGRYSGLRVKGLLKYGRLIKRK